MRVTQQVKKQLNKKRLARFGQKAVKFVNRQFAFIVIGFFVFSLNVVSAPVRMDSAAVNPFINYEPNAVAAASRDITPYVPIINQDNPDQVADQVLSAVVGPDVPYSQKPLLADTIDHKTASRIRRGLRKESVTHVVNQGETLSKIATDYGINVATILQENGLKAEDTLTIKPGTKLVIAPENITDSTDWLTELQEAKRREQEKREQERLARIAAASRRSDNRVTRVQAAASAPTGFGGRFVNPARGRGCYNGYHSYAVDCPGSMGADVNAAAAGVVAEVHTGGWNGGYGNYVVIDHGGGVRTLYAHLQRPTVSPGESVGAGGSIGLNGSTGRSTGPHVHFETQFGGARVNPCRYISCTD